MSDTQTDSDLHQKFVGLVIDYATDLVEHDMYNDKLEACEAVVDSHEEIFIELYGEELTEAEKDWFEENRFSLEFDPLLE
jgi:hypothetical protein